MVKSSLIDQAPQLTTRTGGGIGADGLLLIESPVGSEFPILTIVNSDGSLAATCGNGLRCAAAYLASMTEEVPDVIILGLSGQEEPVSCHFHRGQIEFVSVQMGSIKELSRTEMSQRYAEAVAPMLEQKIVSSANDLSYWLIRNEHVLIKVGEVQTELAHKFGPLFQTGDGINVHLIKELTPTNKDRDLAQIAVNGELGELYAAVSFERGAGVTMACGSGACAIGAYALAQGFIDRESWVGVDMPGGRLYVRQPKEDGPVILAGPATYVFQGNFEL